MPYILGSLRSSTYSHHKTFHMLCYFLHIWTITHRSHTSKHIVWIFDTNWIYIDFFNWQTTEELSWRCLIVLTMSYYLDDVSPGNIPVPVHHSRSRSRFPKSYRNGNSGSPSLNLSIKSSLKQIGYHTITDQVKNQI